MNKQFILVFFVFICSVFGCKNQQEKLKTALTKVIVSYTEKNMLGFTVDSVSILGIDSLTDLDFAYFQKVVYENRESEIRANKMLYIYPVTDEEFDEQEKLKLQLQTTQNHILSCDSILLDNRTDTVVVQYLFVAAKIFGKNKKGEIETHEIGFPIDKNFTVKEIAF